MPGTWEDMPARGSSRPFLKMSLVRQAKGGVLGHVDELKSRFGFFFSFRYGSVDFLHEGNRRLRKTMLIFQRMKVFPAL
jgi:hypothetical protein